MLTHQERQSKASEGHTFFMLFIVAVILAVGCVTTGTSEYNGHYLMPQWASFTLAGLSGVAAIFFIIFCARAHSQARY
jgi:hypothetical protein